MKRNVFFPIELITNILLRLPVKSLLRSKCVCKLWLFLISNPQFTKSHFDLPAAPTHRLLNFVTNNKFNSIDIETPFHDDSAKVVFNILLPSLPYCEVNIVGSCRGFILLETNAERNVINFVIWNPSTGIQKQIKYHGLMQQPYRLRYLELISVAPPLYGVAYDSSSDDYVIVVITFTLQHTVVDFFSLRTNSWSMHEFHDLCYLDGEEFRYGEFLNGALHWLVKSINRVDVIIAFDVREKRLSVIPVPRDLGIAFMRQIYPLKVIGECLCFCFSSEFDGRKLEMWMMKEYKVESSWIKLFVLSTHHALITPLNYPICFTKNGEILVLNDDKKLLRLNYKGEVLEYCDYTDKLRFGRCTLYRESLLSLPGDY